MVTPIAEVTVGVNYYNDTDVTNDAPYYYILKAQSDAGVSISSAEVSATPNDSGSPPSGPLNLVATNLYYSAQLNWSAPSNAGTTPVRMFDIYRNPYPPGMPLTDEVTSGGWVTGYEDSYVLPGEEYNYTVRAINSFGAGSTNVTVRVAGTGLYPEVPENLTASGGNCSVELNWDDPSNPSESGISRYDIYRSLTSSSGFVLIGNSSTYFGMLIPFYTDFNLINGQTYYYKVKAVNTKGESSFSNEASATPNLQAPHVFAYPGNSRVLIMWSPVQNATGYDIFKI